MKKSRFFLALLFVSLLFGLWPATAKAIWDVPVDPGESFRWVFVTSLTTDAYSPDIATYNSLVQLSASIATPVSGVLGKSNIAQIEWRAIASTPDIDAIDNIVLSTAPIYNPEGHLVAPDQEYLFSGSYLWAAISVTESGGWPPMTYHVWTGTGPDGLKLEPLGATDQWGGPALASYGDSSTTTPWAWIGGIFHDGPGNQYHLYAISEELRAAPVIPVPSALILAAIGLFPTLGFMRLRRKDQE